MDIDTLERRVRELMAVAEAATYAIELIIEVAATSDDRALRAEILVILRGYTAQIREHVV